jgi:hypothetical protein
MIGTGQLGTVRVNVKTCGVPVSSFRQGKAVRVLVPLSQVLMALAIVIEDVELSGVIQ